MNKLQTIEEYYQTLTPDTLSRMQEIAALVKRLFPEAEASLSYQMPCYKVGKKRFYFCAFKDHIGVYAVHQIPEFAELLAPYFAKGTQSTVHFVHARPLPMHVIEQIIKAKLG